MPESIYLVPPSTNERLDRLALHCLLANSYVIDPQDHRRESEMAVANNLLCLVPIIHQEALLLCEDQTA
jgi:hypothetical protein